MHRLLVDSCALGLENPELEAAAARHLRVLRPKPGEEIELFDGKGSWRVYAWDGALHASGDPQFTERLPTPVTLFACVTKGSRWDWTVEKATELGAARIVPVISDRTIVRVPKAERIAKRERWQRIAEDAARQSDAKWLPEISAAVDFADTLPLVRETTCFVGALVDPPAPPILSAVCAAEISASRPPAVYVGPEGDFTPDELSALLECATPTSFGPTILRAETAAVFAVGVVVAVCNGMWYNSPILGSGSCLGRKEFHCD